MTKPAWLLFYYQTVSVLFLLLAALSLAVFHDGAYSAAYGVIALWFQRETVQ